jgi:predicted amidophosphoribosyltransferase
MMQNDPQARPADTGSSAETGVVCAKCAQLNPNGRKICESCGAHLFVTCQTCGHRNQRVAPQCSHCGTRLHRSVWRRWRKKLLTERGLLKPLQLLLILLVALAAYLIIVKLANGS